MIAVASDLRLSEVMFWAPLLVARCCDECRHIRRIVYSFFIFCVSACVAKVVLVNILKYIISDLLATLI